jgi:hypothetical protein
MNGRELPIRPHEQAYPRWRRVRDAYRFIIAMAETQKFEATKSRFVARTYGIEESLVKRMKARHRKEISFSGEGK